MALLPSDLPYGLDTWLLPTLLGMGLAAATGLKTFLPLLMLAGVARLHLLGVHLSDEVAWIGSNAALGALGLATVLELVADKFAVVDRALRGVKLVVRPLAAALAAFAVLGRFDPLTAALAGLIIGAPTALIFGAVQSSARAGASARPGSAAAKAGHSTVAWIEDGLGIAAVLVAFIAPSLVPEALGAILLALMLMWWLLSRYKRRIARVRAPSSDASAVAI